MLGQRRYPPFRRRLERASVKAFDEDALTAIIRILLPAKDGVHCNYESFAFTALVMRYRLNDRLKGLLGNDKRLPYFCYHGAWLAVNT